MKSSNVNFTRKDFKERGPQLPVYAVIDDENNIKEVVSEKHLVTEPGPMFKVWISWYQFRKLSAWPPKVLSGKILNTSEIRIFEH